MGEFTVYPAIDLRGGRVVRLATGAYDAETVYGDDPVAVAERFVAEGATWIHVVDLDAARTGDPVNRSIIGAIVAATGPAARVQVGGGVRSVADAEQLRSVGVGRVVMGSAAIRRPEIVVEVASIVSVAVGLDHRNGVLATDGWTRQDSTTIEEAIGRYPDAAAFVVTDIERDGMMVGPDIDRLDRLSRMTSIPVIASGGVGTLDDLDSLARLGRLAGVIVGRALYEGRFGLAEAVAHLDR